MSQNMLYFPKYNFNCKDATNYVILNGKYLNKVGELVTRLQHKHDISSLEQTISLAKNLSKDIKAGSVIAMKGDLGTGKTFLTKHIISDLLEKDVAVTSPTFQLLQIYKGQGYDIYHYDLYRLKNRNEIFELGIEDAMNGRNLCIIEWPEMIFELLPKDSLVIELGFDDNKNIDSRYAICYYLD